MNRTTIPLLIAMLVICAIQLPELGRAPFDHHNYRQCQTATTIEMYAADGIDLLKPRTNYVGEPGVLVLEFPIFQAIAAVAIRIFGHGLIPVRVLNLMFTLASAWGVTVIARRRFGEWGGLVASLLFLGSPLNLAYMSSVLIDPMAVCGIVWAFALGDDILFYGKTSSGRWVGFAACCLTAALIKPLFLAPIAALGFVYLLQLRRINQILFLFGFILFVTGVLTLAWNHYATGINAQSPFSGGNRPTAMLGISRLFEFGFYRRIARRLFIETLGPIGGILAVSGWITPLVAGARVKSGWRPLLGASALGVFGYWFGFANIIFPHDYYSLLAVPFCALAGAAGASVIAEWSVERWDKKRPAGAVAGLLGMVSAIAGVTFFLRDFGLSPEPAPRQLEALSAHRFQPGAYAMIFVGPEQSPGGAPPHEAPALLYALNVRGSSYVVRDREQALEIWRKLNPGYQHLSYVVFWGIDVPDEIRQQCGPAIAEIPDQKFRAFEARTRP